MFNYWIWALILLLCAIFAYITPHICFYIVKNGQVKSIDAQKQEKEFKIFLSVIIFLFSLTIIFIYTNQNTILHKCEKIDGVFLFDKKLCVKKDVYNEYIIQEKINTEKLIKGTIPLDN